MAAVFAGGLLMLIVVLVAPLAAYLPNAAMAGILILVAWGLIDFHHIAQILRASKSESAILLTTFFSTLLLELEFAIFLGVMLSLGLYLKRTSQPAVHVRAPDPQHEKRKFAMAEDMPQCPQLRFVRIDGSLFFGATSYVQEQLRDYDEHWPEQKHLAIVASGINFIDLAGGELLVKEAKHRRKLGGQLYLIRVKEGVSSEFARAGFIEEIGRENIFPGKTDAIGHITQRLDHRICAQCEKRVFRECRFLPGGDTHQA
jgi:SulP family sulfate permease